MLLQLFLRVYYSKEILEQTEDHDTLKDKS